jgi:hypothetical protein
MFLVEKKSQKWRKMAKNCCSSMIAQRMKKCQDWNHQITNCSTVPFAQAWFQSILHTSQTLHIPTYVYIHTYVCRHIPMRIHNHKPTHVPSSHYMHMYILVCKYCFGLWTNI